MVDDPAKVTWTRMMLGVDLYGPWEARLDSADRTCFATIGRVVDKSLWSVTLFPKGWHRDCCQFYYHSDERAKVMIERWAKYHWRAVVSKHKQRAILAEQAILDSRKK